MTTINGRQVTEIGNVTLPADPDAAGDTLQTLWTLGTVYVTDTDRNIVGENERPDTELAGLVVTLWEKAAL